MKVSFEFTLLKTLWPFSTESSFAASKTYPNFEEVLLELLGFTEILILLLKKG